VTVVLTQAAPHHLIADGVGGGSSIRTLRRLRSGDAWQARQDASAQEHAKPTVTLGMPSIGVPAPLPAAPACG
jgi:tRNA-2-methylthio-N6-dimethylallyladenosine synthase